MSLDTIKEKRASLVSEMRNILDASDGGISAENEEKYDKIQNEVDGLESRIRREENLAAVESKLEEFSPKVDAARLGNESEASDDHWSNSPRYKNAFFDGFARRGKNGMDREHFAALQIGTDSEGGYIVPKEFETQLVEILDTLDPIRQAATVISTASDRHIPVESSVGSFGWIAEEGAFGTSDPAFGRVTLEAYKAGGIIQVSEELLQDSFFDLSAYMAGLAARRFNTVEESAFASGDGSGKPRGITVPTYSGNVDAAGAAAITSDELIDVFHSLGRAYRQNSTWLMADGTAKIIRKLKDGDNQYLWQPGLQADQPDTLLGRPVAISDGMPAATTGNKSVILGDMSYYYIADRVGISVQRLNELYAANGQVGFKFTKRVDGDVVDTNAFTSLTQA